MQRLVMQPYPSHLVQRLTLGDGTAVTIRPIRPEDGGLEQEFVRNLSDDWQRKGLGTRLMQALMAAARAAGIREMYGEVLASNHKMLQLTASLGFSARVDESDPRGIRVETTLGQT